MSEEIHAFTAPVIPMNYDTFSAIGTVFFPVQTIGDVMSEWKNMNY